MAKKLYVGNLPFSASEQELSDTFGQYGTVASAKIITDRNTGRSKGFAFVEMGTDDEAAKAIEALNGTELGGRKLTVNEAQPMAPRESRGGFGGGGGGGFGGGGGRGGDRGGRGGFGGGGRGGDRGDRGGRRF